MMTREPANPGNKNWARPSPKAAGETVFKSSFSELWILGKLDENPMAVMTRILTSITRGRPTTRGKANDGEGAIQCDKEGPVNDDEGAGQGPVHVGLTFNYWPKAASTIDLKL